MPETSSAENPKEQYGTATVTAFFKRNKNWIVPVVVLLVAVLAIVLLTKKQKEAK